MRLSLFFYVITIQLAFVNFSGAQNEITVAEKGKQISFLMSQFHLQKTKVDSAFSYRIHSSFIKNLDNNELFFSKSQLEKLDNYSNILKADLQKGTQNYFDSISEEFYAAVKVAERITQSIFSGKIPRSTISNAKELINGNTQLKWENRIIESIQSNVINQLREKQFIYSNDSINNYWDRANVQVKREYDDYFKDLLQDESYVELVYLNSIASTYDPHSNYFNADMNEQFSEELSSDREMFGISYQKNREGNIEVTHTLPGSSAWLSGEIHQGDEIMAMTFGDGEKKMTQAIPLFEFENLFRDNSSKKLTLTIKDKKGNLRDVKLVKNKVYSDGDVIKTAVLDGEKRVGYISLPDFYMNWTDTSSLGCANDLAKSLIKLKKENISGLIIDLRDNGGGSLKEAIDLAGIFIDYGPILVQSDADKNLLTYKDFNRGSIYNGPLTVLINESSASASEVVAGVIQDYNRGLIIGQNSFGKATGQNIVPLDPMSRTAISDVVDINPDWGYVKITDIGLYRIDLTTNQKRGVIPDVVLSPNNSNESFFEKSYINSIDLPSINKKMYYTPLKPLPVEQLSDLSNKRQENDSSRVLIKQLIEEFYNNLKLLDKPMLTLTEIIEIRRVEFEIRNKIQALYTSEARSFKATPLSYDNNIYELSSYMKAYNDDFLKTVSNDIEIEETYRIICDYINLRNN